MRRIWIYIVVLLGFNKILYGKLVGICWPNNDDDDDDNYDDDDGDGDDGNLWLHWCWVVRDDCLGVGGEEGR